MINNYDFSFSEKLEKQNSEFFHALLEHEEKNTPIKIKVGGTIRGTVSKITDKSIYIDVGGKDFIEIIINSMELTYLSDVAIGDTITALITKIVDTKKEYAIYASVDEHKKQEVSSFLNNAYNNNILLTGMPTETNSDGYNIQVNVDDSVVNLFMPHQLADVNKLPNTDSLLHTLIEFYIDVNIKEGVRTFLASRKKYLLKRIPKEIAKLKRGYKYTGKVTGTTDFAVYIQFNECLTAMLHISNLLPEFQPIIMDIQAGQEIEFYLKDIIKDRLYASMYQKNSIWDSIKSGDTIIGTVCEIKDFGLLVDIDFETKGSLHLSSLAKSIDEYKIGEEVKCKVLTIDKAKRKITLDIK